MAELNRNLSQDQFSTWYHGTTSDAAESIRREGLTASSYSGNMTLAADRGKAGLFGMLRGGTSNTSVVTMHIPDEHLETYTKASADKNTRGLRQPLPAAWIHSVDKF